MEKIERLDFGGWYGEFIEPLSDQDWKEVRLNDGKIEKIERLHFGGLSDQD